MSPTGFAELWDRLRAGDECATIEAKRAEEFGNSILETVSAFANEPNLGGGYLLLGVSLRPEDITWLAQFKDCDLTEDEARALICVREVGAINNAAYRDINGLDTLTASGHLRRLRDLGLLDQRGKGVATYYVPTERLVPPKGSLTEPEPLRSGRKTLRPELPPMRPELLRPEFEALRTELPSDLRDQVAALGRRATSEELNGLLVRLCQWRPLGLLEMAALTGRAIDHLRKRRLKRLLKDGRLAYLYPDEPNHPHQKYVAATPRHGAARVRKGRP
jgi:ATP-dependent DNA helicase RecG